MASGQKTVIVTGASQGIGAGAVKALLGRDYNVVANSRNITRSGAFEPTDRLALVDGNIGEAATAEQIAGVATRRFGSIDALVNNAGIYLPKPFTEYTVDDLHRLVSVNIEGFLFITQLAIRQMLAQKTGGSIVNITTSLVDNPIAGVNAAVLLITKGGLQAVTRSLAMEYAKQGIRVNAVAPGIVDTPSLDHLLNSSEAGEQRRKMISNAVPLGRFGTPDEIAKAVLFLASDDSSYVTGTELFVDGGFAQV